MEIVLYNNHYEFHFRAELKLSNLAQLLNMLPLGFSFQESESGQFYDIDRQPGLYTLQHKSQPSEEIPLSSLQANYYLRWTARASAGDVTRLALRLSQELSRELETRVWLLDGYGRILRL